MTIKLSIVFLNYNRLAETQQTLRQLNQLLVNATCDVEIIAIDNGSSDGTAEFLQQQENIKAILLPDNQGIAGYNVGFAQAQGDYLLILDDDSCPADWLGIQRAMETFEQQPSIGVVAYQILFTDGQPQWSWHLPKNNQAGSAAAFIGCGFMIRQTLFADIGWYPASFFLYQNEIDVAFKVRLKGYTIHYDPECQVIHRGEPNQRPNWRRIYYPTRNTLWLLRSYYPQPEATYLIISRLLIGLVRAIQFRQLAGYFKAVKSGLFDSINKNRLPKVLRNEFTPFWRQNSIIHQLFKII